MTVSPLPDGFVAADSVAEKLDRIAAETTSQTHTQPHLPKPPTPMSAPMEAEVLIARTLTYMAELKAQEDIRPERVNTALGVTLAPDPDWPNGRGWVVHGPMPGGRSYRISAFAPGGERLGRFTVAIAFAPEGARGDPRRREFAVSACPFPLSVLDEHARAAGYRAPVRTTDRKGHEHSLYRKQTQSGRDELVAEADIYYADDTKIACVLSVEFLANSTDNDDA